jgi:pantoate--beta-alanine ligase
MSTVSGLPVVRTAHELRALVAAWRRDSLGVGMVPTMGALHAGHTALIAAAAAAGDRVVTSVFVNPTQFAPGEDFKTYPRDEAADLARIAAAGGHAVFAPDVLEMYPDGFATAITVGGPAEGLETDFRPHFFRGVATVVAKLLIACLPDRAWFGEKDYQQLLVVRRMVADLGIPTEIIGHATIREPDGLAMSSRNAYLTPGERAVAPRLHQVLASAAEGIRAQLTPAEVLLAGNRTLDEAGFKVDYLELRNARTLAPVVDVGSEPLRLLVAARLGRTRLIDNLGV